MNNQYTKSEKGQLLEYKKYHYAYKIINLINGKYYFGIHSTDDLNDGYSGSGLRLHEAYRKYGKNNFKKEILQFFYTRQDASNYEKELVTEEEVNSDNCYNLIIGGDNGFCTAFKGKHHKEETKKLVSKKLTISDDMLVIKRRMMHKDGIKKSIKIKDIPKYEKDGWILGASNSSYTYTQEEYLNILKSQKKERLKKEYKIQCLKQQQKNKIHTVLLNIAKDPNIILTSFGWNKIISNLLKNEGIIINSNIKRFIINHCPEFFQYKEVYNKKKL